MAVVRLARSLAASSSSRRSFLSVGNRRSEIASPAINGGEFSDLDRAFYSSSSWWWSSPEDLTAGSKRREKKTTDRLSSVIDAVHDRKLPPELRGFRKSGFTPEWVELNKEIRSKAKEWRFVEEKLEEDQSGWETNSQLKQINNMVSREMFGLKWEKEIDRLEE